MTPCEKAGIPPEEWCHACRVTGDIEDAREWLATRGLDS